MKKLFLKTSINPEFTAKLFFFCLLGLELKHFANYSASLHI